MNYKLFIPGPIHVSPQTYAAMAMPLVSHRSPEFAILYQSLQPLLRQLFSTKNPVFFSNCSARGIMEAATFNLSNKNVLNCMSGAFSDLWHQYCLTNGIKATPLQFEWGQPIDPQSVKKELSTGNYDAITLVHSETSTGILNPLDDIMAVVREFPDIISIVDAVSSLSTVPIDQDKLGIDVLLVNSSKALALPPGLTLFSASQKALNRAKQIKNRGCYFDFLAFLKYHEHNTTPSTPPVSILYGLHYKLKEIIENEGLDNRFNRHTRLNNKVHQWIHKHGFELFSPKSYSTKSLSCIRNNRNINLSALNFSLKTRFHYAIDEGHSKLMGKTFRISNMGDETDESIDSLLYSIDILLDEFNN